MIRLDDAELAGIKTSVGYFDYSYLEYERKIAQTQLKKMVEWLTEWINDDLKRYENCVAYQYHKQVIEALLKEIEDDKTDTL